MCEVGRSSVAAVVVVVVESSPSLSYNVTCRDNSLNSNSPLAPSFAAVNNEMIMLMEKIMENRGHGL